MIGSIERYIYSLSVLDRLQIHMLRKKLKVASFCDLTANQKEIPLEKTIDFYEQCLDILFHHKMEDGIKKMIANVIYQFYSNTKVRQDELSTIEQYVKSVNAKKYAIANWKAISTFFMCNGLFYLAFIAREKYKERLFCTKGRVYRWARVQAYLEDGNIELAQNEIIKLKNSIGMRSAYTIGIPTAERFIDIITNSKENIIKNRKLRPEDMTFYSFLKGKKIVIEGPAPDTEHLDITDNVVYVRSNDFVNRQEKETDILYLNYVSFKLYKSKYERQHNQWKYICFKSIDQSAHLTENTRISNNPTGIFLMGHPQQLPLMIFDLAGEDIYVTGNNLFITSECHNKAYAKAADIEEDDNITVCSYMGNHDAISQYLFLQKLYDSKLFDADKQLTYVMNLGIKKYCKIMDQVHGVACQVS